MKKNPNRYWGNHIIYTINEGKTTYYNWKADDLIESRDNATGWATQGQANQAIRSLKEAGRFPGCNLITEHDKPQG